MRRRLRLAAFLVSTLLSACTKTETVDASTQIMLRISSSDQALLDGLSQLRVAVALREEDGWKEPVSETFGSAELHWPVDIPITPRVHADAFKQFQVVIEALHEQSVLARVLMISGFVPDQRRVLEAVLYTCPEHADGCSPADCRGELCATCGMDGVCKPVVPSDPQLLAPLMPHAGGAGEATEAGPDADAGDAGDSVPDAMPDGNVTPEMACNASCPSNAECVGNVCLDRCTGACDAHAACSVLDGNVHCECSGSYTGDGKSCTLNASCERLHCGTNSQCTLKPGSATDYQCTCLSGYQLVDAACVDIDECKQTPPVCGANATCANTEGSRTCSCNNGFRKNASTGSCENIDDCTPSPCLHGGVCSDAVSDFVCDCAGTGFSGKRCQDNVSDCPLNACQHGSCVDAINDYACTCSAGYTVASNGKACIDCHIAGTCLPAPSKLPAVNGSCPDLSRDGSITVAGSKVQVWVGSKPGPVYFYFHGTGTDPSEVEMGLPGATAGTKTHGGLVASWDVSNETGQNTSDAVWYTGDFTAADQILACAIQRGIADTGRVHVAGYSAGGMQAGTMLFMRSNYLASGIVYSGGKAFGTGTLQDPGNAPAILGAHGAAGSDTLIVDFHDETIALEQALKTAGAFAMDCDDGGSHLDFLTLRAGVGGKALQFLSDHPYAVRPSPYASGIPTGYPSYCKIAQ